MSPGSLVFQHHYTVTASYDTKQEKNISEKGTQIWNYQRRIAQFFLLHPVSQMQQPDIQKVNSDNRVTERNTCAIHILSLVHYLQQSFASIHQINHWKCIHQEERHPSSHLQDKVARLTSTIIHHQDQCSLLEWEYKRPEGTVQDFSNKPLTLVQQIGPFILLPI